MLQATVHRTATEVVCRGHRHWLRLRVDGRGAGARVDRADPVEARWRRVDDDLVALTRAAARLVAVDVRAAETFVRHAVDLTTVPPRDLHPVTGLVRVAFPLLASPPPWPLAALPSVLPGDLQPAFRQRTARGAATVLFGDRATRPVVRALSGLLTTDADLFLLTIATAAAPLLEPDELARVLDAPTATATATDTAPLEQPEVASLQRMLGCLPRRHIIRLLTSAAADPDDRGRLRFVAAASPRDFVPPVRADWKEIAFAIAVGTA